MNDLMNKVVQTPIEIALGIDENGMTTAKKLYEFLGMDLKNYSRWIRNNITENQFAEENVDYWFSSCRKKTHREGAQRKIINFRRVLQRNYL
uniref:antA/AntB antirepressor family protein n=1 Tax=Mediterraneibacter glycyrrhizinilyticus TaxID=342942 RepID=UPI0006CFDE50